MNAKRKWDMRTILLVLIIAVIIIAVIFIVFTQPGEDAASPLNIQEVWQNRDGYIGERITVEGYYYLSVVDGTSCLIPATTVSDPDPDIKINLDNTSLNLAKQKANITLTSNLKYRVVGVLQKIPLPIGYEVKIIVESIKAV